MKPYQKFDGLAIGKMDSYLSSHGLEKSYRTYRPQKSFGDISFDFQRTSLKFDQKEIESLSDDYFTFSAVGKFVNVRYRLSNKCIVLV